MFWLNLRNLVETVIYNYSCFIFARNKVNTYHMPKNPRVCYISFQNNLNSGRRKLITEMSGENLGIHKEIVL